VYAALILFFFALNFRHLVRAFAGVRKNVWIGVLAVVLLAFFLRAYFGPFADPMRSGGWEYQSVGRYFLEDRLFKNCLVGSFDECFYLETPEHPGGYPFTLYLLFIFTGVSKTAALWFNIFVGAVSSALVFMAAYLLFRDDGVALMSAFVFSLFKKHIIYSGTTEAATSVVFFMLLFSVFFLFMVREKTWKSLCLCVLLLFFAFHIQTDNISLVPVFLVWCVIFWKEIKGVFSSERPRFPVYAAVCVLAAMSIVPFLIYTTTNPMSKGPHGAVSVHYIVPGMYAFIEENHDIAPVLLYALLLLGIAYALSRRRELFFLLSWAGIYLGFYLVIYAAHMERYAITMYPAIAVLAGFGIVKIRDFIF